MDIVTTIMALAHSLNLRVVAEGVETESLSQLPKCDKIFDNLAPKRFHAQPPLERP